MTTKTQSDKELFKKLFGEKLPVESADDHTAVIKVWNSGEPFFIEIDLEISDLTLKKLFQIIQKEFELYEGISFVITKRPNVLIQNDKVVKRLKTGDEIEFRSTHHINNKLYRHDTNLIQIW